jgi:hypothetical protein
VTRVAPTLLLLAVAGIGGLAYVNNTRPATEAYPITIYVPPLTAEERIAPPGYHEQILWNCLTHGMTKHSGIRYSDCGTDRETAERDRETLERLGIR